MKTFVITTAMALILGACSLPTNVQLKDVGELRAAQEACLRDGVAKLGDRSAEPSQAGTVVAQSCRVQTDRLADYAVRHANAQERRAFEEDAADRATSFVIGLRSAAHG